MWATTLDSNQEFGSRFYKAQWEGQSLGKETKWCLWSQGQRERQAFLLEGQSGPPSPLCLVLSGFLEAEANQFSDLWASRRLKPLQSIYWMLKLMSNNCNGKFHFRFSLSSNIFVLSKKHFFTFILMLTYLMYCICIFKCIWRKSIYYYRK